MSDANNEETISLALPHGPSGDPAAVAEQGSTIPAVFDAGRHYEVTLALVVDMPPFRYGPRDGVILMKGGVLNRIMQEKGRDAFRTAVAR